MMTSVSLLFLPADQSSAGSYLLSAHGGSNPSNLRNGSPATGNGVVRASIPNAAGNCAHCHEQHASINGVEPVPSKPGPSNYLLFNDLFTTLEGNAMCNYCHGNIATQISKQYRHDPASLKGPAYDPITSKGPVLCNDCHNSHVAQNTNHTEGSGNAVAGPLLSVAGAKVDGPWPAPGNPLSGETLAAPSLTPITSITMEYQLCFKCHGGQTGYVENGLPDLTSQFNPNNYSVHPVTIEAPTTWKNDYIRTWPNLALLAPWDNSLNKAMYCSDCHGRNDVVSNPTGPNGPHGSTNRFLLKNPLGALSGVTDTDSLCTHCHNVPLNSAWNDIWGSGLVGDHRLPAHQYNAITNPDGCLACHGGINGGLVSNVHGANYVWPAYLGNPGRPSREFLVGGLITQNYYTGGTDSRGNRHCASSCHTADGGAGYIY